jgi:hypothetical protein
MLAASAGRTLSWDEALAPFAKLEDFQLDNQTTPLVASTRWTSGSRTAVLQQLATGSCSQMKLAEGRVIPLDPQDPAQQPQRALLDDLETLTSYISYPSRLGEVKAVACGGKWVDVRAAWRGTQGSENAPAYRMISNHIGYLRPGNEVLPEGAGKEKAIIIDLRGNDGSFNPREAFAPWAEVLSLTTSMRFSALSRHSCISPALHWGAAQQANTTTPVSDTVRAWLQGQVDTLMRGSPDGCPMKSDARKIDWDYRKHEFPGKSRVLVVVDEGCSGACEMAAYALAQSPGTVIAGVNTFGASQFIQPGYFVLPHSRLPFRMALQQSDLYGDHRGFDGHGFNVDVLLPTQQSQSQEAIFNLAERLLR